MLSWPAVIAVSYLQEQLGDPSPGYYRCVTLLLRFKCEGTSVLPLKDKRRGCSRVMEALSDVGHTYVHYHFPSHPLRIPPGRPGAVPALGRGENRGGPGSRTLRELVDCAMHLQIRFRYKTSGLEWQGICRVNLWVVHISQNILLSNLSFMLVHIALSLVKVNSDG